MLYSYISIFHPYALQWSKRRYVYLSLTEFIDVTFEQLARLVDAIDIKYMRFSNIASEDTICDSDIFNGHQLVDCELLALVFNTYKKKETM